MQKLCGKRTERFEVTTSSSAASDKICIRYNMKFVFVTICFKWYYLRITADRNYQLLELPIQLVGIPNWLETLIRIARNYQHSELPTFRITNLWNFQWNFQWVRVLAKVWVRVWFREWIRVWFREWIRGWFMV